MYVQQTSKGNFQYVERYKDSAGKWRRVSVTLPGNRKADRIVAEKALKRKIADLTLNRSALTFGQLVERYMQYQRRELKAQTAATNTLRMNVVTGLIGKDTLVSSLTAPYVREKLYAEKATTYNERIKHFKAMMRWAYREELVDDISYIDKITRRKDDPVRVKVQDKFLEKEELTKLLDGMKETHWRLLTEFLALSGLRVGEAIALHHEDVDLEAGYIHVTKTYSRVIDTVTDSAKTEMSVRDVFIQDELRDCIKEVNAFCATFLPSPYFFGWEDGKKPISYDVYNKYIRENTERILGRRLTAHALRHTHVALLAEAGISLDAISRRLGHADSSITRDVYYHVTQRKQAEENEAIRTLKLL